MDADDDRFPFRYEVRGGSYELAIELRPGSAHEAIDRLVSALGSHASFGTWYRDEAGARVATECSLTAMLAHGTTDDDGVWPCSLVAVATLHDGARLGCGLSVFLGADPAVALYTHHSEICGEYAIDELRMIGDAGEREARWIGPVDGWLRKVAERAYRELPFTVALIGHETASHGLDATKLVPDERWVGVLRDEDGHLAWYPRTVAWRI